MSPTPRLLTALVLAGASLFSACGPKAPPDEPARTTSLPAGDVLGRSPLDLAAFWAPWFDGAYEYMFVSPQGPGWGDAPALARDGMVFGSGISGFYFYGGLDDCLRAALGGEARYDHDEYASLAALAGRPFRIGEVGQGWDRGFGRYDPAVIDWALRTLVPHPSQPFAGGTFQQVYDRTFFRVVRLHARAWIELRTRYDLEAETRAYLQAMQKQPDFDGVGWLDARYTGALADCYPLDQDGTLLTAPMVLGFWLRRHADGSDEALVRGLGVILRAYDRSFVQKHAAQMGLFG